MRKYWNNSAFSVRDHYSWVHCTDVVEVIEGWFLSDDAQDFVDSGNALCECEPRLGCFSVTISDTWSHLTKGSEKCEWKQLNRGFSCSNMHKQWNMELWSLCSAPWPIFCTVFIQSLHSEPGMFNQSWELFSCTVLVELTHFFKSTLLFFS